MEKTTLVVVIRGWCSTGDFLLFGQPGGEIPASFVSAIESQLPLVEVWCPQLEMDMFSSRSPESLSKDLFTQLEKKLAHSPHVSSIVLIGFSSGSLLARRVFCMAHGADLDGTVNSDLATPWSHLIDRMVILSGITRGWEYSSASPAHVRFLSPLLFSISSLGSKLKLFLSGNFMQEDESSKRQTFIWQLFRGSPFVVSARLQYLNVCKMIADFQQKQPPNSDSKKNKLRSCGVPTTVFLLGAKDEFISPADCTELGPRSEFVFVELPGSSHLDAIQIDGQCEASINRRDRLVAAIAESFYDLSKKEWIISPDDINDYIDPMDLSDSRVNLAENTRKVDHVVLIMHGIRDNGFWTKRVAREIKKLGRNNKLVVRAPTPSYGYFSMWDFVRPGGRERATYWFLETYSDIKTYFPNAKVSFVGHSNGTYIAARALQLCSAIHFENIVFAGSVVRSEFDWRLIKGRAKRVLNYVGKDDKVVAFLPNVLETFNWLDVGGAGAFGFKTNESIDNQKANFKDQPDHSSTKIYQVKYVNGGHGAAIVEDFWPELARFALLGEVPERAPETRSKATNLFFTSAPFLTSVGVIVIAIILSLPVLVPLLIIFISSVAGWAKIKLISLIFLGVFLSWVTVKFIKQW